MSDLLTFADEPARPHPPTADKPSWKILVVDDEPAVHSVTKLALRDFHFEGRSLEMVSAYSADEAKQALDRHKDAAVMLLDVVMETERSGLDLVHYIRENIHNDQIRIVLRTGQPGQAPEQSVIRDYDINDYKEKTELTTQKLSTTMYASLRAFRDIVRLKRLAEELRKSKAAVEVSERAKAAFVSTVSHELRTPLNAIMGLSELMHDEMHGPLGDSRYKQYVWDIHNSGRTLLAMVDNILEITDDATEIIPLKEEEFDLAECVNNCLTQLSMQGGPKIKMREKTTNSLRIRADWTGVQRMLLALLTNALKFGAADGHFEVSAVKLKDGRLMLSVLDDGPGIGAEEIAMLSTPFSSHQFGDIAGKKGLGLGLSVAKLLIERHDGELTLENRHEGGARANLIFPADRILS